MAIPNIDVPIYHNKDINNIKKKSDSFRVIFIKEGRSVFEINGLNYSIFAPCLICLNSDDVIRIENQDLIIEELYFSPIFINKTFTMENLREKKKLYLISDHMDLYWLHSFLPREKFNPIILSPLTLIKVKDYFRKITYQITNRNNIYWPCKARAQFMQLLFLIENERNNKSNKILIDSIDTEIDDILLYINKNYKENLTIDFIAKEFGTNRTSLNNKFRRYLDTSVASYIKSIRLHMAMIFLKETYLSITDIMYESGFSTPANFNKSFKEYTNLSPREYRTKFRS